MNKRPEFQEIRRSLLKWPWEIPEAPQTTGAGEILRFHAKVGGWTAQLWSWQPKKEIVWELKITQEDKSRGAMFKGPEISTFAEMIADIAIDPTEPEWHNFPQPIE